jgi:hypothetical protein
MKNDGANLKAVIKDLKTLGPEALCRVAIDLHAEFHGKNIDLFLRNLDG